MATTIENQQQNKEFFTKIVCNDRSFISVSSGKEVCYERGDGYYIFHPERDFYYKL
ncbi:MAG: hypothetical protein LBU27_05505 [Candidatus Peribacteria bacterium]|nr:hypothetical protein [Candidatus Peribacteria bacterium]